MAWAVFGVACLQLVVLWNTNWGTTKAFVLPFALNVVLFAIAATLHALSKGWL